MLYALNKVCARTMQLTRHNMLSRCDFIFCRLHFVFSVFYVLCSRSSSSNISSLSFYVFFMVLVSCVCDYVLPAWRNKQ